MCINKKNTQDAVVVPDAARMRTERARFSGQDRMKGDRRILGDSAFVMEVLAEAEEKFEGFYELKSKGYDLDTVEQKVCRIFGVEPDEIYSKNRQKTRAETRGLGMLCEGVN